MAENKKKFIPPSDLTEMQETYVYPPDIRKLDEVHYLNKSNEYIPLINSVNRKLLGILDYDLIPTKKQILNIPDVREKPELKYKDGLKLGYLYGDINSFEQRMLRQKQTEYFSTNGDIKDHSSIMVDSITTTFPITETQENPYYLKQENALASKRVNKNKNKYYRLDINVGKLILLHHPLFSEEDKYAAVIKETNEKYDNSVKYGTIQFYKDRLNDINDQIQATEDQSERDRMTAQQETTQNQLNDKIRETQTYANDIYSTWKLLKSWRANNPKQCTNNLDLKIQKSNAGQDRIESFVLGQLKQAIDEKGENINKKSKDLNAQLLTIEIKVDGQIVSKTNPKQLNTSFEIMIQQMFTLYVLTMPNEITLTIYINGTYIATGNVEIPGSKSNTITSSNYSIEWVYFENKKLNLTEAKTEDEKQKMQKDYETNLFKGKVIVKAEWEREGDRMPPFKIKYTRLQEPSEASTAAKDDDQTELLSQKEELDANDPENRDKLEKLRNIQLENLSLQIQESSLLPLSNLVSYRQMLLKAKMESVDYDDLVIPLLEQEIANNSKLMEIIRLLQIKENKEKEQNEQINQAAPIDKRKKLLLNKIYKLQAQFKQGMSNKKITVNNIVKELIMEVTFSCSECLKSMFEPRRKLKPRKIKKQGVIMHLKKECIIKVHIMKGHNLPIRDEMGTSEDLNKKYEEAIMNNAPADNKSVQERFVLPPNFNRIQSYVEVYLIKKNGESQVKRTEVLEGIYPEWNQVLEFNFKASGEFFSEDDLKDDTSTLYFNIFDYRKKISEKDDSTAILSIEKRYIGSFSLPLITIFENSPKLDATIEIDKPICMLGYHTNLDQVMEERIKKLANSQDANAIKEGVPSFISLSCYFEPIMKLPTDNEDFINKSEDSLERVELLEYGFKWAKAKRESFKDRTFKAFASSIEGVNVLLSRFIKERRPPKDIVKEDDSESTKYAIEGVARYVSMIPFLSDNSLFKYMPDVWSTNQEFLDIGGGDYEEHAVLLCNYFNYIDHELKKTPNICSFVAVGKGIPEGNTSYVIRREKTPERIYIEIWNPLTGKLFYFEQEAFVSKFLCIPTNRGFRNLSSVSDTLCMLKSIGVIVGPNNIYANIQHYSDPTLISYDFENPKLWEKFITPELTDKYLKDKPIETYGQFGLFEDDEEDSNIGTQILIDSMESSIIREFEGIRNVKDGTRRAMRTKWNRKLYENLAKAIDKLEEYKKKVRNGSQYSHMQRDKFNDINQTELKEILHQQLDAGYDIFGFPINTRESSKDIIWQMIKNTSIHLTRHAPISG